MSNKAKSRGGSDLLDYLSKQNCQQVEFAKRLGMTQGNLSRVISGAVGISLSIAFRIEEETDRAVTAKSWLEFRDASCATCRCEGGT